MNMNIHSNGRGGYAPTRGFMLSLLDSKDFIELDNAINGPVSLAWQYTYNVALVYFKIS